MTRRRLGHVAGTKQQRGAHTRFAEPVATLRDESGFSFTVSVDEICPLTYPAWMKAQDYTGWAVDYWPAKERNVA